VRLVHKTVKKVGEDIEAMRFNTAVSALMVCSNGLADHDVSRETFGAFLKIVSPFAPHLAEECWQATHGKGSLAKGGWPTFDPALAADSEITLAVQVNGKLRGTVRLAPGASEAEARAAAEASDDIKKHLEGKEVKRVIYVQGRLLSYVV
jgi:leucyl-tRNA synthetase